MPEATITLQEAIARYSASDDEEFLSGSAAEQTRLLERFPLAGWEGMSLEQYAIGHEGYRDSYCYAMEWEAMRLGSIRGGSSKKLLIYWGSKEKWEYDANRYASVEEAWQKVREGFLALFQVARDGRWDEIDDVDALSGAPALRLKSLYLYFPDEIVPTYAASQLRHFLRILGDTDEELAGKESGWMNRRLLRKLREVPELSGWSTMRMARMLYFWSDPNPSNKIVKIAPGENARFWEDCLSGGYICCGWDQVGDLRKYESQEAFQAEFNRVCGNLHKNHLPTLSKKGKEVWTFRELEPGDIVVANRGTSHVLAIGEVVAPGYEWMPERAEFKHILRVKWDTRFAKDITKQPYWALVTVQDVPPSLYHQIREGVSGNGNEQVPVNVPPVFGQIADALERKGQVILYGPPGTGKTYTARRFAAWWLQNRMGKGAALPSSADSGAIIEAENSLSNASGAKRAWWVVANPSQWTWESLFPAGKEKYRKGRLQRNYPLVQPGDLVIGYHSAPIMKVVALARIASGLTEDFGFEVVPEAKIPNGITWEELLQDPVLSASEPIKNRCQGSLFALTPEETDHLLSLLMERNPTLGIQPEPGEAIASLTRMTFHPSYSYEDFIEGFRPRQSGADTMVLQLDDGVFKRVCREATANPKKTYLVLIDEINRANIAKVFGELITLLEKDKRGLVVTLPQSREPFSIPPNVYLIGTMNTADRSIKLLDAALRRRFAFLELMPDAGLLRGAEVGGLPLDDFLVELNRRVAKREGREKQIGHSYLLEGDIPVTSREEFARRFRQEILPLLQEYCYDDYRVLAEFIGAALVDQENQLLNAEAVLDDERLIEALENEFCRSGQ